MEKLYVDAASLNGGGAFVLKNSKQTELVYAGVTVYSMSPREWPDYDTLERANSLRFLFDDMPSPEPPCYPVPQMDVFALDDDGWFASLGGFTGLDEPWPIVYLRRNGTLLRAPDDLAAFARLLQAGGWREHMVPEPSAVRLFPSRRDAEAALKFIELPPHPPQGLDIVGLPEELGGANRVDGKNQ